MILYHVDRTMKLKPNSVLNYRNIPKNANREIIEYCDSKFPGGTKQHWPYLHKVCGSRRV